MISNIDNEQVISTNTTTQKKIQTPPKRINESITNKEEQHKKHQLVKKTPEPQKNETQHPIFEKIGDSTYRISDRTDLSKVAELTAIEFSKERLDIWGDFNKVVGGDPVSVLDECSNSYYELIPLYIYNEYAGLVQFDYLNQKSIKVTDIFPSAFFHSNNLSEFKDKFIPIDKDEAINILEKKFNIDNVNIKYNDLTMPCIGKANYNPKIDPFHSFTIGTKKYLVNIRDGELITEQDKSEIENELFQYLEGGKK